MWSQTLSENFAMVPSISDETYSLLIILHPLVSIPFQTVLKEKLTTFYQNHRRRALKTHQQSIANAIKFGRKKSALPKNVHHVGNYFPGKMPEGEDERTISILVGKLKEQAQLHPLNQSVNTIRHGMKQTFHLRRSMILEKKSIADILNEFPILGQGNQVKYILRHSYGNP